MMDRDELRNDVDYALKELGVDCIDIIVLCRVSPTISIEERYSPPTSFRLCITSRCEKKPLISPTLLDIPPTCSIETMAELVKEGKARHIALSEASAATIRRAHAIAPIYCIEQVNIHTFIRLLIVPMMIATIDKHE